LNKLKEIRCNYVGINSPLNWYGGKYYLRKKLIELFPYHHLYAEGCGGAAHVLAGKSYSQIEVYNDKHEGLYLFFKILRDPILKDKLIKQLQLTPYSREEFINASDWETEIDEIEKARKFYIRTMQSVNTVGGWSASLPGDTANNMAGRVSRWLTNIDINIELMSKRLRKVQIENLDILKFIAKYDAPTTFFYLDPPYVSSTRVTTDNYKFEMTVLDHKCLVDILIQIKGKVMLSGYDNSIYDKLEAHGFSKILISDYKKRSSKERLIMKEYVWVNYDLDFLSEKQLSISDL